MSGHGDKSPNLERLAADTASYFMAVSQEPSIVVSEGGKFFSEASVTRVASDVIVANLSLADKASLLAELAASDEKHGFYLDAVFEGSEVTYKDVIDTLLSRVLCCKIIQIPEILERERENVDLHDEFNGPLE